MSTEIPDFLMQKTADQLTSMLRQLEAKLEKFEMASPPDMKNIAEAARRIDLIKQALEVKGAFGGVQDHDIESFDQWATDTSMRFVDPSVYGNGPQLVTPQDMMEEEEPAAEAASQQQLNGRRLPDDQDKVKNYLINDTLKKAYASVTRNAKVSLRSALTESGSTTVAGMLRFRTSMKKGFQHAFEQLKYDRKDQLRICYHLVLELDEQWKDIEVNDEGSARIVKNVVAREFLTQKILARPEIKEILS